MLLVESGAGVVYSGRRRLEADKRHLNRNIGMAVADLQTGASGCDLLKIFRGHEFPGLDLGNLRTFPSTSLTLLLAF